MCMCVCMCVTGRKREWQRIKTEIVKDRKGTQDQTTKRMKKKKINKIKTNVQKKKR